MLLPLLGTLCLLRDCICIVDIMPACVDRSWLGLSWGKERWGGNPEFRYETVSAHHVKEVCWPERLSKHHDDLHCTTKHAPTLLPVPIVVNRRLITEQSCTSCIAVFTTGRSNTSLVALCTVHNMQTCFVPKLTRKICTKHQKPIDSSSRLLLLSHIATVTHSHWTTNLSRLSDAH